MASSHIELEKHHIAVPDDILATFEAVMAREPWRAEMLMREHVASIKTSLVGYLSERKT